MGVTTARAGEVSESMQLSGSVDARHASVVVGGRLVSTMLTLFLFPALLSLMIDLREKVLGLRRHLLGRSASTEAPGWPQQRAIRAALVVSLSRCPLRALLGRSCASLRP